MRFLWWCACAPFRLVGWLCVVAFAVCAAFDHDDDPGGHPISLAPGAQKQHPILPGGRTWSGERFRHRGR